MLDVIDKCKTPTPAELTRFVESAPRYTSYPPADQFTAGFGPADATRELVWMGSLLSAATWT